MSVNMFEGARRIMKLVMIIIALIGIYAAFDASSDIKAGGFTLMDDGASGGGGQPIDYASLATKLGGVAEQQPQQPQPVVDNSALPQQGKAYLGEAVDYDPFAAKQAAPVEQQVADRLPKKVIEDDYSDAAKFGGVIKEDYSDISKFGGVIDDDYSDISKFGGVISQEAEQPQPAAPVAQPQQALETIKPWEKYKTTATEQPQPVQPIDHYEQQAANDEQFVNKQYWPKKQKPFLCQ